MKTVEMDRDFDYSPTELITVAYKAGETYQRVPEAHAAAIVDAGAGRIVNGEEPQRERRR